MGIKPETPREIWQEAGIKLILIIQIEEKWDQITCPSNIYIYPWEYSPGIDSWDSAKDTKEPQLPSKEERGQVYESSPLFPTLPCPLFPAPAQNMNFEQLWTVGMMKTAMKQWAQPREGMLC